MIREIKIYPEPVLKKKAAPILKVTSAERELIKDMMETLPLAEGVGLAAPQLGVSARIAIAKDVDKGEMLVLINPSIIKRAGSVSSDEGCLSIPGVSCRVKRWKEIVARFTDTNGKTVTLEARDLLARIIQHELDHLNGVLIVDRLNLFKRRKILEHFKKDRGHFSSKETI